MSYQNQPLANVESDTASGAEFLFSAILQDPGTWALFLDIDGTLLDLAETPDGIAVPPDLPGQLDALSAKLGGALALVTGRGLAYADRLFAPLRFPIAGLHGAERRAPDGSVTATTQTAAFQALKADLTRQTEAWPGVLIEDKGAAVAAHYRQAPEREIDLQPLMQQALDRAGPDWHMQHGKMVIEIRPSSADKGHAVEAFLAQAPFKGRRPIAIGDDVTDEAMFRAINPLGGLSIRVGPLSPASEAKASIASAAELRGVIAKLTA